MMNLMTKGYIAAQLKTEEFMKNNRGSIVEYVMVIALAATFIVLVKKDLSPAIEGMVTTVKGMINPAVPEVPVVK
ncbi:pilus assembly protein [Yersinia sp. Marseille-Q3913]|uniref:pilus assembly protein n=1 Tax=Yersinia sp. Marseille-Q3913 TaxID=2830769 RepID=UPI001BB0BFC9|nr:pilus assembly protein [Yersinia sp. Marseille-Q3913]MBS0054000.1 pilus assembly protein [Yersinia sp. Marseille-Q3913]